MVFFSDYSKYLTFVTFRAISTFGPVGSRSNKVQKALMNMVTRGGDVFIKICNFYANEGNLP